MGVAELDETNRQLVIHATVFLYGDAASESLAAALAADVASHWNAPRATVTIKNNIYLVVFDIAGLYAPNLQPAAVYENDDPHNNYFRVEEFADSDISSVDGLNSNTGYFKLDNLANNSTTAAHEFGHSIGLEHPAQLDIRGRGQPGIMYPRGTIVDPSFQYDPAAVAGAVGGTMNPYLRKVLPADVHALALHRLSFNRDGITTVGDFSSVWHDKHG